MWRVRGGAHLRKSGRSRGHMILVLSGHHSVILMCSPGINKQGGVSLQSGMNVVEKLKKKKRDLIRGDDGEKVWEGEDEEKQKETL